MADEYEVAEPYNDRLVQERREGFRPVSAAAGYVDPVVAKASEGRPSLSEQFAAIDAERAEKSLREGGAAIGRINSYAAREEALRRQRIGMQQARIGMAWERVRMHQAEVQARMNAFQSANSNPDQEAQYQAVAQELGVPVEQVRNNPQEFMQRLSQEQTARVVQKSPQLAQFLSDPDNAKVAHDDTQNLSLLEEAWHGVGNIIRGVAAGVVEGSVGTAAGTVSGYSRAYPMAAEQELLSMNPEAISGAEYDSRMAAAEKMGEQNAVTQNADAVYKWAKGTADVVAGDDWKRYGIVGRGLVSGFRSVGAMVPGLGVSVLTGSPMPALIGGGLSEGTSAFMEDIGKDRGFGTAAAHATFNGTTEILTEAVPVVGFLKDGLKISGTKDVLKSYGKAWLRETPSELAATALQNLGDISAQTAGDRLGDFLSGNMDSGTYAKMFMKYGTELPAAELETFISVLPMTLAFGTAANLRRIRASNDMVAATDVLLGRAEASKLNTRQKALFDSLNKRVAEGQDIKTAYIDRDDWNAYWNAQGVNPEKAATDFGVANYQSAAQSDNTEAGPAPQQAEGDVSDNPAPQDSQTGQAEPAGASTEAGQQAAADFGVSNYQQAAITGEKLEMPVEMFIGEFARSGHARAFVDSVTFNLEIDTGKEAAQRAARLEQDVRTLHQEIIEMEGRQDGADDAIRQAYERQRTVLQEALENTGMTPEEAYQQAVIAARGHVTMVARDAIARVAEKENRRATREEVAEAVNSRIGSYGLTIDRETGQTFNLRKENIAAHLPRILKMLRSGTVSTPRERYGANLMEAVRERGGLRATDEVNGLVAAGMLPADIVSENGVDAAELQQDAGIAGYLDGRTLVRALQDQHSGGYVAYNEASFDAAKINDYVLSNIIAGDLKRLGIDLAAVSDDAEVARRLAESNGGRYGEQGRDSGTVPETEEAGAGAAEGLTQLIGTEGAKALDAAEGATVRLDNLAVARDMEAAGEEPETIKLATGWERGADGLWRYELTDMRLDREAFEAIVSNGQVADGPLDESRDIPLRELVMDADEVFTAYPELADTPVRLCELPKGLAGMASGGMVVLNVSDMVDNQERTVVHEVQHLIQAIEGFAPGTDISFYSNRMLAVDGGIGMAEAQFELASEGTEYEGVPLADAYEEFAGLTEEDRDALRYEYGDAVVDVLEEYGRLQNEADRIYLNELDVDNDPALDSYKRTAGEVEARNVESRFGMTAQERLASLARDTEDVAREDQILLEDDLEGGVRISADRAFYQAVSVRLPGRRSSEDPYSQILKIDYDLMKKKVTDKEGKKVFPAAFVKNVDAMQSIPGMKTNKRNPASVSDEMVDRMADNLLFIYRRVDPEFRDRSIRWYEGANRIAVQIANRHNIEPQTVSAVLAVLSPATDWAKNVTMAERIVDIFSHRKDYRWDDAMSEKASVIAKKDRLADALARAKESTLGELLANKDYDAAGIWVRCYDEAHHSQNYRWITPEGGSADFVKTQGGENANLTWGRFQRIGDAVAILNEPDIRNISDRLAEGHKIRNFYNNIDDPTSPDFATIDTHAVAAALLQPLSIEDKAVKNNFGREGSAQSADTGMSGTYPFYFEAYRRAAEEAGVLPVQMQVVTWVAVRSLFTDGFKQNKANKEAIESIWRDVDAKKLARGEARERILEMAQGFDRTDWEDAEYNDVFESSYDRSGFEDRTLYQQIEDGDIDGIDDKVVDSLLTLGENDAVFRYPVSDRSGLAGILESKGPFWYSEAGTREYQVKQMHDDYQLTYLIENRKNSSSIAYVRIFDRKDGSPVSVAIDSSRVGEGMEGSLVKDAVMEWCLKKGFKYEGDRAGYSDLGRARTLESMLSSALKHGTTRHIAPKKLGLDWREGDDVHNVRELVREVTKTAYGAVPELDGFRYNAEKDRFEKRAGKQFRAAKDSDFQALLMEKKGSRNVRRASAAQSGIGLTTAKRAVLLRSMAGMDGQVKPKDGGSAIDKIFYQRKPKRRQKKASGIRGEINIGRDRSMNIKLFARANFSTFVHETGHFMLEVMSDLVRDENASQYIRDEFQKVRDYLGAEEGKPFTTEQHERFARSFEAYLMEGKAPTPELRSAFAMFKNWLTYIYRTLAGLNVRLNDDIREVFDRMIATDEEIALAAMDERHNDLMAEFDRAAQSGALGLTQQELEELRTLKRRELEQANDELRAKLMRSKVRERQKQFKDAVKSAREKAGREYDASPLVVLAGELAGEERAAALNEQAIRDGYGEEVLAALKERNLVSPEGTAFPDELAEDLEGYENGAALVRGLASMETRDAFVERRAKEMAHDMFPDTLDMADIAAEVDDSMNSTDREDRIKGELKVLRKYAAAVDVGRRAERRDARAKVDAAREQRRIAAEIVKGINAEVEAIKGAARATVMAMPSGKLRPNKYIQAMRKAAAEAKAALSKATPDYAKAAELKRTELLNFHLYRAARDLQVEVRKKQGRIRDIARRAIKDLPKTRTMALVYKAKFIAGRLLGRDVRAMMQKIETEEKYNQAADPFYLDCPPMDELSVADALAAMDQAISLWEQSRRDKMFKDIDENLVPEWEARDAVVSQLKAFGPSSFLPKSKWRIKDKLLIAAGDFLQGMTRMESWADMVDGGQVGQKTGPMMRYIVLPIKRAAERARERQAQNTMQLAQILEGFRFAKGQQIEAPELGGFVFGAKSGYGKAELVHAILHTGNASNKARLLIGHGWGEPILDIDGKPTNRANDRNWRQFIQRIIEQGVLTEEDMDRIQQIWDMFEALKKPSQEAHKAVFGRYFDEITAEPFELFGKTYEGGYIPAIYDKDETITGDRQVNSPEELFSQVGAALPKLEASWGKNRVDGDHGPLLLDLQRLNTHMSKQILFAEMAPACQDVSKILRHRDVQEAFRQYDPDFYSGVVKPWMSRAVTQTVSQGDRGSWSEKYMQKIRNRAGLAIMFGNAINAIEGFFDLTAVFSKVKGRYVRSAFMTMMTNRAETVSMIKEKSAYMRERLDHAEARAGNRLRQALRPSRLEDVNFWMSDHAYFLQEMVDGFTAPTAWLGAYTQAAEAGLSEDECIQQANHVVRSTFGTMNPEDIANAEAGNVWKRLFTQFTGYFFQRANLIAGQSTKIRRSGAASKAALAVLLMQTVFLPAWIGGMIRKAFAGSDEDESWGQWLLDVFGWNTASYVAGMGGWQGGIINAAIDAHKGGSMSAGRVFYSPTVKVLEDVIRNHKWTDKDGNVDMGNVLRNLANFNLAVPVLPIVPNRPVASARYALQAATGEVRPTGPVDLVRGLVSGRASKDSKR